MNADKIMCMTFYEEITRGSVGFAQSVIMNILMGTYFIFRFGSEAIKERCLYPAMRGEKVATMFHRGPVGIRPGCNQNDCGERRRWLAD